MGNKEYIHLIAERLGSPILKFDGPVFDDHCRLVHEGFTYRITSNLSVEKARNGLLYIDDDSRNLERILKNEIWDGEGSPPVGCEFEYQSSSGWVTANMKFCGRSFAIVEVGGLETWLSLSANIRPIRSEADKKRDEFVDQVMQWMHHAGRAEVELIYDAIKSKKIRID